MIKDVFQGVLGYFEAISFAIEHKLMKYFIMSSILGVILWMIIFFIVFVASFSLSSIATNSISSDWLSGGVLAWIIGIVLLLVFFITFKYIYVIVLSPFMGPLANKVAAIYCNEPIYQNESRGQFIKDLLRSTYLALRNIIREIFYSVLVLIASLIPGVAILTPFVLIGIQSYYAGFGNIDFFMEGRYDSKESVQLMKSNKGMAIGNGLPFIFIILIPIFGAAIALPLATISGTLQALKKGY